MEKKKLWLKIIICSAITTVNIYLFKVNIRNTRKRSEIYSKWTIKIPEWPRWRRSGVFKLLLTLNIVFLFADFEQVNVCWIPLLQHLPKNAEKNRNKAKRWNGFLSWRRSLSCKNQSIDLQSKSLDWFQYDKYLPHERVTASVLISFPVNLQRRIQVHANT